MSARIAATFVCLLLGSSCILSSEVPGETGCTGPIAFGALGARYAWTDVNAFRGPERMGWLVFLDCRFDGVEYEEIGLMSLEGLVEWKNRPQAEGTLSLVPDDAATAGQVVLRTRCFNRRDVLSPPAPAGDRMFRLELDLSVPRAQGATVPVRCLDCEALE